MRLLPVLLLFVFPQLSGQSWFIRNSIGWKYDLSGETITDPGRITDFKTAYYRGFHDFFPHHHQVIAWDDRGEVTGLELMKYETQSIPDGLLPVDKLQEIGEDFRISYSVSIQKGKKFLQFSLLPFRKNSETGSVERITSFIVEIKSDGKARKKSLPLVSSYDVDSPLAGGDWFKVRTEEEGMHRISWEELSNLGLSDPSSVRIYGYGGQALPENLTKGTQDEFISIPVYLNKGDDGVFNSGDFLLFYATGNFTWTYDSTDDIFEHSQNSYSDEGYYFITSGQGSSTEPGNIESVTGEADYSTSEYDYIAYYENDDKNLIESGQEWYGELFDATTTRTFEFDIPNAVPGEELSLKTNLLGRAKSFSYFRISANGQVLDTAEIRSTNLSDYTARFAYTSNEIYRFPFSGNSLSVRLNYLKPDATARGWLDYLAINARSALSMNQNQITFRDRNSRDASLSEYILQGANTETQVWDITSYPLIKKVPGNLSGSELKFQVPGGDIREFVAFNPGGTFPSVRFEGEGLGRIENQNLKGSGFPDLIIVSHPDFLEAAGRLAQYRREVSDLDVIVTTPDEIYNEFSSGRPDVTAIRNFLSWLYYAAGDDEEKQPQYLLFFGDASFIFKEDASVGGNYVPTYQSANSLSPVSSFLSDDFFGLLDAGEDISSGLLDIGIGRLPLNTAEQAEFMVDKIIRYESPESIGEWRNTIAFIGDDEDNNIHFSQADELAEFVEDNYSSFNINKIYLDAYPQVSTTEGQRYPGVNAAINDQVNRGALIINYTGHGGTKGLAHEQILTRNDIMSWENDGKLPLFMTATCEFSRFDKPDIVSAGEEVILSAKGGGIALLTTTRLVYAGPNHVLNEKFYEVVFEKNEENENYSLGDIMQYSKNNAGFGINKRNFTLLGDPAMRLTYPQLSIVADSINQEDVTAANDTIRALSTVTISGYIEDPGGNIAENYQGQVIPIVYDKKSQQTTLANDGGQPRSFTLRNNIIYKGKVTVNDGRFSFSFVVPKDINYTYGGGKVSFYSTDSTIDASGSFMDFTVGGSETKVANDFDGPDIAVFMNDEFFFEGGITDTNPVLYVEVYDDFGINTTGIGIGHDITAVINNNTQNTLVLNEYYQADLDSYRSGTVRYPMFNLAPGDYTIDVKVWDIFNNSSSGSTSFTVVDSEEMMLENLLNYPNPFRQSTYLSFEHNRPGTDMDITIDIFNTSGALVKTIKTRQFASGYRSEPVYWDGNTESGNNNRQGLYMYRIRVKTSDGEEAVETGRMLIIR